MTRFFQQLRLPKGHIAGFSISQAADRAHDLTIGGGETRSLDDLHDCRPSWVSITKQIDAAFAEGDNAGGIRNGGAVAANTEYLVNLMRKNSDPSVFDVCFTTVSNGAETGWTYMRTLDIFKTDAGSIMRPFTCNSLPGGVIEHKFDAVVTVTHNNPGTNDFTITPVSGLPDATNMSVFGLFELSDATPVGTTYGTLRSADEATEVPSASNYDIRVSTSAGLYLPFDLTMSATGLVGRLSQSTADHNFIVMPKGYRYNRAR